MVAARAGGSPNWRLMPWLAASPASRRAPSCWPIRPPTNFSLTPNDVGNDRCFLPFQAYPDAYGACPGHRSWHPAATDGRDKPGHDDRGWDGKG